MRYFICRKTKAPNMRQGEQWPGLSKANRLGPAAGARLRGKSEQPDPKRPVGIRFDLIKPGPCNLRRTPEIYWSARAGLLGCQQWRRSLPRRRPAEDEGAGAMGAPGHLEGLQEFGGNAVNMEVGTTPLQGHQTVVVRGEMARRRRCLTPLLNCKQQRAGKGK
jgi:hypothetical protein